MSSKTLALLFVSLLAASAEAQSTQRASVDSAGAQANQASHDAAISADGRYIVFASEASNLVAGDTNAAADVFVRDRQTGQTTRVSVDGAGTQGNGPAQYPSISADGRYVAFTSIASNLAGGDANGTFDVFVHDRTTHQTILASLDSNGVQGNGTSYYASISADGLHVAFDSGASNLVAGDTNGVDDVFVRDLSTGQTVRASVDSAGVEGNGNSYYPSISADGRYVAFTSLASNLVAGDTNGGWDVFVHDCWTRQTTRASVSSTGAQADNDSSGFAPPSISADGRYVAFWSFATNLVAGDTNGAYDVFVHDMLTGETRRVSVDSAGAQADSSSFAPSISADGRYVAFDSGATNLVAGDTNSSYDVLVHDVLTGQTSRVSVDSAGVESDSTSFSPAISADGRWVAFQSNATNLVPGDTNGFLDVFARDRSGSDPVVAFCAGDGSATACPCANSGSAWHGCANSQVASGALLLSSGTPRVSADSFELDASGMPSSSPALFFQGTLALTGAQVATFGDGLRCVGGAVVRLGTKISSSGMSSFGSPAGDAPVSVAGMIPPSGGTFHYQAWYRNADPTFCTAATFNLTNGLSVPWGP